MPRPSWGPKTDDLIRDLHSSFYYLDGAGYDLGHTIRERIGSVLSKQANIQKDVDDLIAQITSVRNLTMRVIGRLIEEREMPKIKAFPHKGPSGDDWGLVFDLDGAGGHKFLAVLPEGAQGGGQKNSKYFDTEEASRTWLDKIMRGETDPEPTDA